MKKINLNKLEPEIEEMFSDNIKLVRRFYFEILSSDGEQR